MAVRFVITSSRTSSTSLHYADEHTPSPLGAIISISLVGSPSAIAVPQTSAQTWAEIYNRGANVMPKVAGTVALSYAYAAYAIYSNGGRRWQGFAAAATCVVCIVPFTLVVMKKTNAALHHAAENRAVVTTAQVSKLLNTWGALNYTRGLLPLVGTVIGLEAFWDTIA